MSGRPRLAALGAVCAAALGWPALVWLGGELLSGGLGEGRSHAAFAPVDLALLIGAAAAPAGGAADAGAEIAAAEAAARQALEASPLDSGALAMLGLAAAARAEPERAERLMQLAAARAPADLLAQGWLFHRRLMAEDRSGALAHADAMLRARPDLLEPLLPALAGIATDPEGLPALAAHLETEPPWRGRFLERLAAATVDPLAPFALHAALMAGSRPPSQAELRPYLRRLVDAGLFEQARLLWTQALPAERLAEVGYLANGGFEEEPTGFLFDWSLETVAGARAEIATLPDGDGGRALRIQFLDRRVAFQHVKQLLMLMPGRYRLTGRVRAEALRNERGLHWTLSCADEPGTRLGATERVSGTTRWQRFDVAFEVPASGCRAQWLRLELAARIAAERHAAGAAWYDDMAVTRIDDPDEDSCPDGGPVAEQPLFTGAPMRTAAPEADETVPAPASLPAAGEAGDEAAAQCTCSAPLDTPAELREAAGDVMIFRGEQGFAVEGRAELLPGDRVMVRAGGRALLAQGECRFDLTPQSVVTLRADECVLCAAVVTAGEAEVAYAQSADGAGAAAAGGGGFVGSPQPALLTSSTTSPLSGLVVLPGGETRPPASQ